ncbi:hypothetical protein NADFUDRAFT_45439 [Nadsonia fulvescens var. elongata DSM 6958]|uniref:Uncharacterized protein n=1 Tax=Nadsonia fulvescens var. elongata DSM 6958 TaxID=857566 RepID=A0A1E3PPY7_9ASCO|nr:hypothetical protein NADFUDRAFT_45439 [Nadsonia fulvescens var. elongata DSM 6958]
MEGALGALGDDAKKGTDEDWANVGKTGSAKDASGTTPPGVDEDIGTEGGSGALGEN